MDPIKVDLKIIKIPKPMRMFIGLNRYHEFKKEEVTKITFLREAAGVFWNWVIYIHFDSTKKPIRLVAVTYSRESLVEFAKMFDDELVEYQFDFNENTFK